MTLEGIHSSYFDSFTRQTIPPVHNTFWEEVQSGITTTMWLQQLTTVTTSAATISLLEIRIQWNCWNAVHHLEQFYQVCSVPSPGVSIVLAFEVFHCIPNLLSCQRTLWNGAGLSVKGSHLSCNVGSRQANNIRDGDEPNFYTAAPSCQDVCA